MTHRCHSKTIYAILFKSQLQLPRFSPLKRNILHKRSHCKEIRSVDAEATEDLGGVLTQSENSMWPASNQDTDLQMWDWERTQTSSCSPRYLLRNTRTEMILGDSFSRLRDDTFCSSCIFQLEEQCSNYKIPLAAVFHPDHTAFWISQMTVWLQKNKTVVSLTWFDSWVTVAPTLIELHRKQDTKAAQAPDRRVPGLIK